MHHISKWLMNPFSTSSQDIPGDVDITACQVLRRTSNGNLRWTGCPWEHGVQHEIFRPSQRWHTEANRSISESRKRCRHFLVWWGKGGRGKWSHFIKGEICESRGDTFGKGKRLGESLEFLPFTQWFETTHHWRSRADRFKSRTLKGWTDEICHVCNDSKGFTLYKWFQSAHCYQTWIDRKMLSSE